MLAERQALFLLPSRQFCVRLKVFSFSVAHGKEMCVREMLLRMSEGRANFVLLAKVSKGKRERFQNEVCSP